jgi:FlaA1/EpsC-like NDP-sugar epimerase
MWCIAIVVASFRIAYLLRFDFEIPSSERQVFYDGLCVVLVVKGVVFCALQRRLDRWSQFSGFWDVVRLFEENVLASILSFTGMYLLIGAHFPRSVFCLDFMVCFLASGGVQFSLRALHETRAGWRGLRCQKGLIVYGAGVAGLALAREVRCNPSLGYHFLGFLDDDPRKEGAYFLGFPVLGTGTDARRIVATERKSGRQVEIVVAMPSASGLEIREAVSKGSSTGVSCRVVPGLGELINGKLPKSKQEPISVTDLLNREHVNLNEDGIGREIAGRTVLVTGAAGSIGSELCFQLAQLKPARLIAVDQAESELFRLTSEIQERHPDLHCWFVPEIADIRNRARVTEILEKYQVSAIFHAAAYKHVPVMEHQVWEAVTNNVIGTWNLVQTAWRLNVPRFLLISTDKAVNPSSIMGLTKRVAELIVCASRPPVGHGGGTRCVCVRFGNVLVSNGSVVPIFQRQIARGGPVTVTHPDVRRYFMTVQEAVQLVLQASIMGRASEIFVLDMGKPVRVVELARRMILMAGLTPGEDIEIRFVGLRPGEKLFEEISLDSEDHLPTTNPKIRIFRNRRMAFSDLAPWMAELQHDLWIGDPQKVVAHLKLLVPEYEPQQAEPAAETISAPEERMPFSIAPAAAEQELQVT